MARRKVPLWPQLHRISTKPARRRPRTRHVLRLRAVRRPASLVLLLAAIGACWYLFGAALPSLEPGGNAHVSPDFASGVLLIVVAAIGYLLRWGDKWLGYEKPLILTHLDCGKDFEPVVVCDHCRQTLNTRDMRYHPTYRKLRADIPAALRAEKCVT